MYPLFGCNALRTQPDITAENLLLKERVSALEERIAVLLTQIAWLRKQMFGGGKGEKADLRQLEMKLEELDALMRGSAEAEAKLVQYERVQKAGRSAPFLRRPSRTCRFARPWKSFPRK